MSVPNVYALDRNTAEAGNRGCLLFYFHGWLPLVSSWML